MEHNIGEIVTLPDGRKAKVVEDEKLNQCNECIFGYAETCTKMRCQKPFRTDHKNIIYKEIKED